MGFLRSMLTTDDNQTGDIVRVTMTLATLCHVGLTVHGAVFGATGMTRWHFQAGQIADIGEPVIALAAGAVS